MKDILTKLRILIFFLEAAYADWKENVWEKNLDSHICCNGNECACRGITIRENYKNLR